MKRVFSMLLVIAMVITMLPQIPLSAAATEQETTEPTTPQTVADAVAEEQSESELPQLTVEQPVTVTVPRRGYATVRFVPAESGVHTFSAEGGTNPYGYLYLEDGTELCDSEFPFTAELEQGVTYLLDVEFSGTASGDVTLSVSAPVKLVDVKLGRTQWKPYTFGVWDAMLQNGITYNSYKYEWWNQSFTATFSDGSLVEFYPYTHWFNNPVTGHTYSVIYSDTQSVGDPWLPGNDYTVALDVDGVIYESTISILPVQELTLNQWQDARIEYAQDAVWFSFVPDKTDTYVFTSNCAEHEDTYAKLYDADFNELSNDVQYEQFKIVQELEAGKTYYCAVSLFDDATGTVPVIVTRDAAIERIEFETLELAPYENGWPEYGLYGYYFHYNEEALCEQLRYTVYLDDGTSFSGTGAEVFVSGNSYEFSVSYHTQNSEAWLPGQTCQFKVCLNDQYYTVNAVVGEMQTLPAEEDVTVSITEPGQEVKYYFTPERSSNYTFTSISGYDTAAELYNEEYQSIISGDNNGDDRNFVINYYLYADETYILNVHFGYETEGMTGEFVIRAVPDSYIKDITFEPVTLEQHSGGGYEDDGSGGYYRYYWWNYLRYTVTMSDGREFSFSGEQFSVDGTDYSLFRWDDGQAYADPWLPGNTYTPVIGVDGVNYSVSVTITGFPELVLDAPYSVSLNPDKATQYLKFAPAVSGLYTFTSNSDQDTYGDLYDANFSQLTGNDDDGDESNFLIRYALEAGQTYYLAVRFFNTGNTGSFPVTATKEMGVSSIQVEPIEMTAGTSGSYTAMTSGASGENYFRYYWWNRLSYTVTFENGDSCTGTGTDFYYDGQYYSFSYSDDQSYVYPWTVGNTYTAGLTLLGVTADVQVTINPVTDATVRLGDVTLTENTDGYYTQVYDSETQQYKDVFVYSWWNRVLIELQYSDCSTSSTGGIDYNGEYAPLGYSDLDQRTQPWTVGNTYSVQAQLLGQTFTVNVTIRENPIDRVEFAPVTVIENTGGSWNEYYDGEQGIWQDYYHYAWWNELSYTVYLKDGTSFVGSGTGFSYNGSWFGFATNDRQGSQEQWTVGNTYTVNVGVLNTEYDVPVTVVENPISSVTFDPIYVIENTDGYWSGNEAGEFFYYEWCEKLSFTVHLADGTSIKSSGRYVEYEDLRYYIDTNDSQYDVPWTAGGQYEVQVSWSGDWQPVQVQIVANPVSRIEFKPIMLERNSDGHDQADYSSGQTYWHYDWQNKLQYTVTCTDGTVLECTGTSFAVGQMNFRLNAYDYQNYYNPWEAGSTNYGYVRFGNADYSVEISISDVAPEELGLPIIAPNQEYTLSITEPGQMMYFAFSPAETGEYIFQSNSLDGSYLDTYGYIYDSSYRELAHNDDGADTGNGSFRIAYTLQAGKTYIFGARMYDSGSTGSFLVKLIRPLKVTSVVAEPLSIMVGTGGYMDTDEFGNDYYFYRWWEQLRYTVFFENGEQITVQGGAFIHNGIRYDISCQDIQRGQHWQEGGTYQGVVIVQSVGCPVEVTIEASPVERIELAPLNMPAELRGYYTTFWNPELQEDVLFYYYHWYNYVSGTVYFRDGKTAAINDGWYSYEGEQYSIGYSDNQYENPFQIGGSYIQTVTVMGVSQELTITVSSPVRSVVAEPIYMVAETGGEVGYINSGMEQFYRYYWWNQLRFTVTYKDGSQESFTGPQFHYDDCYANVRYSDADQHLSPWQAGGSYTTSFRIMGVDVPVQVNIISEISGELGNVTWTFGNGGTLQLLGQGDILWDQSYRPWEAYRRDIRSVVIGEGITSIPDCLFERHTEICSVTLADTVTRIGRRAFFGCSALSELHCSAGLQSIGEEAFYQCVMLTDADLGSSLQRIDSYAFADCTNLTQITLPNTLSSIGSYAFNCCYDLQTVNYAGTQNAWELVSIGMNNVSLLKATINCTGVAAEVARGQAGESLTWVLDSDGVMIISGTGAMEDYTTRPWEQYAPQIRRVIIEEGVTSVGSNAFFGCTALKDMQLPGTLTKVGDYAFYCCYSLSYAMFTPALEEIGSYAFGDCGALRELYVGSGLKRIGEYAFSGCDALQEIYYEAPGTQWGQIQIEFGNEALEDAYMYTAEEEGVLKSGVCGENLIWTLNTENTLTISGTGPMYDYDFSSPVWADYAGDIYHLEIRSGVTYIGNAAFRDCYMLGSIQLPGTVTEIGLQAFYGLYNLEELTLPEGLTGIRDEAFAHCDSLRTVTLPESLTVVGFESFAYCSELTEISIPAAAINMAHNVFYGCQELIAIRVSQDNPAYCDVGGVMFTKDMAELLCAPGGLEGSYTIPEGVETIALHAFQNCGKLTQVVIPDSVTSIAPMAFQGCINLQNVELGNGITVIEHGVFANTGLTEVVIPSSVTDIEMGAFEDCTALTQVTIPEGVTRICDRAFAYCVELSSAPLPASLTYLGSNVFEGCGKLQSISIPANVTEIGQFAFANCESLTEVTVPATVQSVGAYAFRGCINLQKLELPEGVTSIGEGAFEACVNLTEAKLPEGVTEFVYRMFAGCESLETVEIPSTVVTIGEQTFAQCTGLTEVNIPDSVQTLGDRVFAECESLQTVSLGKGVADVSPALFNDCYALTAISVSEANPSYSSDKGILFDKNKTELLRCPMGFEGDYEIPETVGYLRENAFRGCDQLTGITVPAAVSYIPERCFADCGALRVVDLSGTGVEEIRNQAFAGCVAMEAVTLPQSLLVIGEEAFADCHSLTAVEIPEGVQEIYWYAFSWCSGMREIYLPESLWYISEGVFNCCNALETVHYAGTKGKWDQMEIDRWGNENLFYAEVVFGREAQLTGLNIVSLPEKLEYLKGEALDLNGLWLEAVYDDGSTRIVTPSGVSGYDHNTVGEQTVTVTYEAFAATFTVVVSERPVEITVQPVGRTAPVGSSALFTVEAANVASYQWQYRRSETGSWTNTSMDGCKTDTLTVGVTAARNGYQYRCKLTGNDGQTYYTEAATLTVGERILEGIEIRSMPTNTSFYLGQAADFTGLAVVARYSDGAAEDVTELCAVEEPAYMAPGLYTVTVRYAEFTAEFAVLALEDTVTAIRIDTVPGKTEYIQGELLEVQDLIVIAEMASGAQLQLYDYVISGYDPNALGEQTVTVSYWEHTATFTVTVKAQPATVVSQPADQSGAVGDKVQFTVAAIGAVSYKWEYRRSASATKWSNTTMTGYNTDTLTVDVTAARNGYQYRCVITGADGEAIYTEPATLTVAEKPVVTVTGIEVTQQPDKTEYRLYESFDSTGVEVGIVYSDGSVQAVADGYTFSGFDSAAEGEQVITVTYGELTTTFTVNVEDPYVTEVQTGVAYKYGMNQKNVSSMYYLTGLRNGYYLDTTTDAYASADVYLTEAEGGYYLHAVVNGTRKYINVIFDGTYVDAVLEDTAATVYTFDADTATLVTTVNDILYRIGTRADRTYTTVGPVKTSNDNFFCRFYLSENIGPDPTEPVIPELPDTDGAEITIADALAAGGAMSHNTFTSLKYKVTGTVDSVVNDYGNMYLRDDDGDLLYIYGVYSEDGTVAYRDLEVPPVVGDTVTLYGAIGKFYGTVQMKSGWLVEHSGPVRIMAQPESVETEVGMTAQFAVKAGFVESYKWQLSKDGGVKWYSTTMPGYNTDTLSVEALEIRNGYMYRCQVTGLDGTVLTTEPVTLTVSEPVVITGIEITQQPDKTTYLMGEELDLTGLIVTATYSDGTTAQLTGGFDRIDGDTSGFGVRGIFLVYGNYVVSFDITVCAGGTCGEAVTWAMNPNGVLTISGQGAMEDYDGYNVTSAAWGSYAEQIHTVVIEEGVTYIGTEAFYNLGELTSLVMADSLEKIGNHAFFNCEKLESIQWSAGLKVIGSTAFGNCYGLTEVILPEGLITVETCAFADCEGLRTVVIPSTVTDLCGDLGVDNDAFAWCDNLSEFIVSEENPVFSSDADGILYNKDKTVIYQAPAVMYGSYTVRDSVLEIQYPGFQDSRLTEIVVGENVKVLDGLAFRDCQNLEVIRIPVGIETIHDFLGLGTADADIYKLSDVYYGGTAAQWEKVQITDRYFKKVIEERLHTVAPQITHLSFYKLVEKLVYEYGEELDLTGLILRVLFHDDTEAEIIEGYTVTGYSPNVVGKQTVTVSYEGFEASFEVEVLPAVAEITQQPEAANADSGATVSFHVETEGQVASYQWQYRSIYKWFNTSMEGYNTDTLYVEAAGSRHGYDYRCQITFADGTVLYTEPAELTVNTVITVTGNPNDQVVALGAKGQFTAAAEGESIKYQWQYCRPGSDLWIDTSMEGATKATVLIETTAARNGYQYRCRITDATGNEAFTEAATLSVLSIKSQPADAFAPTNGTATFRVTTSVTEGFTYQWQYSRNSGNSWSNTTMAGYNTATLTVGATAARNGYQYRCVITGAKNSKVTSNAATLHVSDPVVITAQPASVACTAGQVATFSVEASNAYAYQWYYRRSATGSWYKTGADGNATATLNVTTKASNNGYQYRCVITGLDGITYYTEVATLTFD